VPGAVPEGADLALAPPQEPAWWIDPAEPASPPVTPPAADVPPRPVPPARMTKPAQDQLPTLFDEPGAATPGTEVTGAVLKSPVYAAQKKIAGRVSVSDGQIRGLLGALLEAPGQRLVPALAATALAVSPVMLRGAVLHAQALLNVEGYPVLRVDADGATVILDEALLREQFGIRP